VLARKAKVAWVGAEIFEGKWLGLQIEFGPNYNWAVDSISNLNQGT
jgi:hypothetical protein